MTDNTLIGIQDSYGAAFASAKWRWSRSKTGGHSRRIIRGARKAASERLARLGLTEDQIKRTLSDAEDMSELELSAMSE